MGRPRSHYVISRTEVRRSADLHGWLTSDEAGRLVCTLRRGIPHIGKDLETGGPLVPRRVGALRDGVEALGPLLGTDDDLAVTIGVGPLADVLECLVVGGVLVNWATDLVRAPCGDVRELVQRQHDGVVGEELADLMDQVDT